MTCRNRFLTCLSVCIALAACNSGPPSSNAPSSGEAKAAALERKADHLSRLLGRRHEAAQALDDLTSALPESVRLTEVVYDASGVQIKGGAPTNNLLADYLSRLGEGPSLENVILRGSAMKTVRGRERVDFFLQAAVRDPGSAPSPPGDDPAVRLEALEKVLPPRQDTARMLRELQMLALESGLQMTRFAPGVETAGEFTGELPVSIEVSGDLAGLGRYLRGLAGLDSLWTVERFSFKAALPDDPRSEIRAAVAARANFPR